MAEVKVIRSTEYSCRLAKELWDNREVLTDFKLKTRENRFISCDRLILAANSSVLKAAVLTDMKEARDREMNLGDYSYDIVLAVVRYMYTGSMHITGDQLMDVVHLCDFLNMRDLLKICERHVTQTLTTANVIGWLKIATLLQLESVIVKSKEMIASFFREISLRQEFLELSFEEMCEYINDGKAKQVNCDDLVKGIFIWIDHQHTRIPRLGHLVHSLSLQFCSAEKIADIRREYRTILLHNEAFNKQYDICCSAKLQEHEVQNIIMLGGQGNKEVTLIDEKYLFKKISEFPDDAYRGIAVCSTELGLIVTGGYFTSRESNKVFLFIPSATSPQWKELPKMQQSRNFHACAYKDSVVYVLGGYDRNWIQSCEQLILKSDMMDACWEKAPQIPKALRYPRACSLDGRVFMMGSNCEDLYAFNPGLRQWDTKSKLPNTPGIGFSMAANKDKLFIAGGLKNVCSVYYPKTDTWNEITNKPVFSHCHGAMVMRGVKLVLLGGKCRDVEEYDLKMVCGLSVIRCRNISCIIKLSSGLKHILANYRLCSLLQWIQTHFEDRRKC